MPEFFTLKTVDAARADWFAAVTHQTTAETIPTSDGLDRVLSAMLHSAEPLPAFAASTVDGYAVRAADTYGASAALPAYLTLAGEVQMGQMPAVRVGPGQAVLIHTGGALPGGANAVVMIEHTQSAAPGEIEVVRPVAAGENVTQSGEDLAVGDEILPAGHRLRVQDIGGLMALGHTTIPVRRRPVVAILATGDEVIPPDQPVMAGQVRDINSYTVAALTQAAGGVPRLLGIVPDDYPTLRQRAAEALTGADLLVLSAGSSVSTRDMTATVFNELGGPGVIVHGLAIKPGKPAILGSAGGKPVIGLPGNPVSALTVFALLGVSMVWRLQGAAWQPGSSIPVTLSANVPSVAGREDYIPARLRSDAEGTPWADPLFGKSNHIFRLVRAEGLIRVPLDANGIRAGERAEFFPF